MQFKGYTLNSFQVEAAHAVVAGKNVLLAAPTGSGKTLVAEYAIEKAIAAGGRAIYTSPIKALSSQKYRDFVADGLDVGLMTGDLTLEAHAPLVIMTTEIFRNAVFEDPGRFDDLDFVIFDEVHFLDDPSRGTVWEESLIFAPPHVKFICLSATIQNLEQFGNWLREVREHDLAVIEHKQRPVPLEHRLYHPESGFFNIAQRRRAVERMRRAATSKHGGGKPSGRHGGRNAGRGGRGRQHFKGPRPYLKVLDGLQEEGAIPILFFCFSRKECEIKARLNTHRRLLDRKEQGQLDDAFDDICDRFELDPNEDVGLQEIHLRARCGIGYHHAGMLPIHKEVVERLFTSGLLKLLFTTETFALGINMPARTVVFDLLRKYDGVSMDYMKARDYMQMAGRAGRQGIDDAGLVVSILENEDLENAPLPKYFGGQAEPVNSRFNMGYSTILNLYEHMGPRLVQAYDRSFAAFQASTGGKKARDRKQTAAKAELSARMRVLREAGYLDDKGLLSRGRLACAINGYEIQVTELLFAGVLEDMDIHELVATFCALVHEERRRDQGGRGHGMDDDLIYDVEQAIRRFVVKEVECGVESRVKPADFAIAPAVQSWSRGGSLDEMAAIAGSDGGDVVRTMRMAIQMMRNLRKEIGRDDTVAYRLEEAIVAVNRDVVDAKRQFELG